MKSRASMPPTGAEIVLTPDAGFLRRTKKSSPSSPFTASAPGLGDTLVLTTEPEHPAVAEESEATSTDAFRARGLGLWVVVAIRLPYVGLQLEGYAQRIQGIVGVKGSCCSPTYYLFVFFSPLRDARRALKFRCAASHDGLDLASRAFCDASSFFLVTSSQYLYIAKGCLPIIAALRPSSRSSHAAFLFSSSIAASPHAVPPSRARQVLHRRYNHDADGRVDHDRVRPDEGVFGLHISQLASSSSSPYDRRKSKAIAAARRVDAHLPPSLRAKPEAVEAVHDDIMEEEIQPSPHQTEHNSLSSNSDMAEKRTSESPLARKPASKTVLNGGLGIRERNERKARIQRIAETVGVREAQEMQRHLEKEDENRKACRKARVARLKPYIAKQLKLIELEAEEQRKEVELRQSWSLDKLVQEGWALDKMEGYWLQKEKSASTYDQKRKLKRKTASYSAIRTAAFHRPGKARLGWTKLSKGDQIELKRSGLPERVEADEELSEDLSDEVCVATVRSVTDNEIRLNFETPFHDLDLIAHPLWRIDMAYNDMIEQRLRDSVEALLHDVEATQRAGAELSGTRLVDMLLEGGQEAEANAKQWTIANWINEHRDDRDIRPNYGTLNDTQRQAVDLMLSEPISLIQGPPGTGKTSTIVAAIKMLKKQYQVPHPILLTSHTNVAVDNLAQGCKDAGLNVIRSGAMVRVRDSLSDVTVEGLLEKHPSKPRLDELEAGKFATIKALQGLQNVNDPSVNEVAEASTLAGKDITDGVVDDDVEWLVDALRGTDGSDVARLQKKLSYLIQKSYVLRREMETDIYRDVDVVCCTALSAPLIRVLDFPIVFFDEATMATEPVTIATMIKGCQQISLIGDQQQLSPLVKSREVIDEGLGLSLFERLMERGDVKSIMLGTQHRMHPTLSDFPNQEFYDGRLHNAEGTHAIPPIISSYLKSGEHLSLVDHKGRECVTKNKSLENNREADIIVKIIADVLCKNEGIAGSDIGIITPYLGQKELLWKSLQDPTSFHRALLSNEVERLGGDKSRLAEINDIEIHTIDGFEGREKKVIIFSLVRANAFKYLGFLKEEKRWNVALTRAKNALIIVGNASMLDRGGNGRSTGEATELIEEDTFLHRYADHLRQDNRVISAKDVP